MEIKVRSYGMRNGVRKILVTVPREAFHTKLEAFHSPEDLALFIKRGFSLQQDVQVKAKNGRVFLTVLTKRCQARDVKQHVDLLWSRECHRRGA